MRFCPQCGAPLISGAKFCVECGSVLAGTASGAGESGNLRGSADRRRNIPITTAFVVVFVAITVVGLAAAAWIMMRTPEAVREQVAVANVPGAGAPQCGCTGAECHGESSGGWKSERHLAAGTSEDRVAD